MKFIWEIRDYNRHYFDGKQGNGENGHPTLYGWWHTLLTSQPCVFIGTSLREPGLAKVVEFLLKDGNPALAKQNHIHLKEATKAYSQSDYDPPGKTLRVIEQVLYDPVDSKFSGLLDVLSAFSDKPRSRFVVRNPKRKPITANENYIF